MTASTPRILLVEDEQAIADGIQYSLAREGYDVHTIGNGEGALARDIDAFDLVLLDLMLPGIPGHEVCRRIRESSVVPIIMLTARTSETDRVLGLEIGADDYLAKPFSTPELIGRIRAILRRRDMDRQDAGETTLDVGDLHIDLVKRTVRKGSHTVALTPSEFRVLATLAARAGQPVTRHELLRHLWQTGYLEGERVCDTHIKNLRRKLEPDPSHPRKLVTVRGVGYMLLTSDEPA